jgi:hypothetical protein
MKPSVIKGRILYPQCAKTRICNLKIYFGVTPLTPVTNRRGKEKEEGEERGEDGRGGRGGETVKCAVEIFIYFRLCSVLPSGAVLMLPNDFKLTAIIGSKCHTIQTKFNVEKDF